MSLFALCTSFFIAALVVTLIGMIKINRKYASHAVSETCKCGHHTNDHSYNPKNLMNDDLNCDKCECIKFVSVATGETEDKK